MAVLLASYLGTLVGKRFDWATCNCFFFCADWIVLTTGRDPAATWRGIQSQKEGRRVVRRAGGDIALVERAMAHIGCPLTSTPVSGDVALVRAPVGSRAGKIIERSVGAICIDGKSFAVMTGDLGLVITPLPLIRAWSVVTHG